MEKDISYYNCGRSEIISYLPSNIKSILDIGCGNGFFLKLVKEQVGAETWGIEAVKEIAENAKPIVDKLYIGEVETIIDSLPDNYFDCVTCNDVLEHLVEPGEVLQKILPKLKKNACVIASIPNVRYINNIIELVFKKDWKYKDYGILDATHLRFFTKKSIKRMFESSGYLVLKLNGLTKTNSIRFFLLNILTLGLINDMKYAQYICIATKNLHNIENSA